MREMNGKGKKTKAPRRTDECNDEYSSGGLGEIQCHSEISQDDANRPNQGDSSRGDSVKNENPTQTILPPAGRGGIAGGIIRLWLNQCRAELKAKENEIEALRTRISELETLEANLEQKIKENP